MSNWNNSEKWHYIPCGSKNPHEHPKEGMKELPKYSRIEDNHKCYKCGLKKRTTDYNCAKCGICTYPIKQKNLFAFSPER